MNTLDKPDFVMSTYIKTSEAKLWEALTTGSMTKQFFQMEGELQGDIVEGGEYSYEVEGVGTILTGTFLDVSPTSRLEMTFIPNWDDKSRIPEVPSRNVYEIEESEEGRKLTISHFGVTLALEGVRDGWIRVAARLKTLLETGEPFKLSAN